MICQRCGYSPCQKSDLVRHLKKKVECPPIESDVPRQELLEELTKRSVPTDVYECSKCKKPFSTRQGKHQHMKICKAEAQDDVPISREEYQELKQQMEAMQQLLLSQSSIRTINNNTNNNNTNNTNNGTIININMPRNFGHENMEAVSLDSIRNTFMNLEFGSLFEELHCDPDYPENHNVRIKSMKRNMLEIYKNDRWNTMPCTSGIREVIKQIYNCFHTCAKQHRDIIIEEDMDEDEFDENIKMLAEVQEWIDNTQAKLNKCRHAGEIIGILETHHKMLNKPESSPNECNLIDDA